jgi:hypothetical protein
MSGSAWHIGRLGGNVIIRVVQRGEVVIDATFAPDEAEHLATKLLNEVRVLRPPPPPKGLRVVK